MVLKYQEFVNEKLSKKDFVYVEDVVDNLFSKYDIDVQFTKHFMERVNDDRNIKDITIDELIKIFKDVAKQYGDYIADKGSGYEGVIKDLTSMINIPITFKQDYDGDTLALKTAMRTPQFRTGRDQDIIKIKT